MTAHAHQSPPLIEVFDMPTSVAFYRDVIGFEVVMQSSSGDNCD
jgi:catechol 2,3-dioxygenase-like lactoylglutathione lyase family enzyme